MEIPKPILQTASLGILMTTIALPICQSDEVIAMRGSFATQASYYQSPSCGSDTDVSAMMSLKFKSLCAELEGDTSYSSDLYIRYSHPAYKRILEMKKTALPFILNELRCNPSWWFDALTEIAGEDAAKPEHDFDEATEAWLKWGNAHGYNV